MNSRASQLSRRAILAATASIAASDPALAAPPVLRGGHQVASAIRRGTPEDVGRIAELLVLDGQRRMGLDPGVWRMARDPRARIESAVRASVDGDGRARELWLLAEAGGRMVGVAHAMIVPVPPIYDVRTGHPGLLLDDCCTTADAPPDTAEALLEAMEAALHGLGVATLIASCAVGDPWRTLYDRRGYEAVTWYMGKQGFEGRERPSDVRSAAVADVPDIVALSADHRRTLARLNPRFWTPHPEADVRFGTWMRYSLTLRDRDMMVAGPPGGVHGYVIAQPVAPLLVPAVHAFEDIGVIDDFYDRDFADVAAISDRSAVAADLLSAAESAFARRSFTAGLVVCPAAWTSKAALLRRRGYHVVKQWMLKA
jgi:hypothetical protein